MNEPVPDALPELTRDMVDVSIAVHRRGTTAIFTKTAAVPVEGSLNSQCAQVGWALTALVLVLTDRIGETGWNPPPEAPSPPPAA